MAKAPEISKLPKFVQEYIKDILRERDLAIRSLNEYVDKQTTSPIYYDDHVCTGESATGGPVSKRVYIQTHKITVDHQGVELSILLRDNHIDMQWSARGDFGDIAFIPTSYQSAKLVSNENMRKR